MLINNMKKTYIVPVYITKPHNKISRDKIIFTTQYNNIRNDVIKTYTHKKCLYCSKSNLIFNKICLQCDKLF